MSRMIVAIIIGVVTMTVIGTTAVIARPAWMSIRSSFNTTIYEDVNATNVSNLWADTRDTVDYLYWLVPGAFITLLVVWLWMNAQEKEYVTVGGYR